MIIEGRKRFRYLILKKSEDEIVAFYRPEQILYLGEAKGDPELMEMVAPLDVVVEYYPAELAVKPLEGEEKESLKRVLIWLDENLPKEEVEKEGWLIVPETYAKPDIGHSADPEDYERIKRGGRRKITEIPEWQVYFGETTDDDVL
ncbi:MAG: hypothetical protein N3B10_11765 [Armatimonadetes bacterium]|nr:hypothetical protein [Armatimonadota bacterium]